MNTTRMYLSWIVAFALFSLHLHESHTELCVRRVGFPSMAKVKGVFIITNTHNTPARIDITQNHDTCNVMHFAPFSLVSCLWLIDGVMCHLHVRAFAHMATKRGMSEENETHSPMESFVVL